MIPWTDFPPGNHRVTCFVCGRGPKDRTLGITIEDGAGVAHCHRCHHVENWRDRKAAIRPGKAPARPVVMPKPDGLSEYGLRVWRETRSLRRTIGADNLLARYCALPPEGSDVRFHPALRHPSGYIGPALVALITDAITGKPISLHFTWINGDGTKAAVDPPRLLLAGHRKQGGVIRLWPDEYVSYGLGIGEGIETALTLATVLKPAWSLIDAGNLAAFPVLPGIEALTIAVDNDPAGLKAATECATRWTAAGCDVRLVIPPRERADLNDIAREAHD